ncbi:MAG: hypothetical protein WCO76_14750, partial [Planctomycetota bacterium]
MVKPRFTMPGWLALRARAYGRRLSRVPVSLDPALTSHREDTQVENLCYLEWSQRGAARAREPALLTS